MSRIRGVRGCEQARFCIIPQHETENTALHHAVRAGQVDMVRDLLKHGADLRVVNAEGEDCRAIALRNKAEHPEVHALIQQKGAWRLH